MVLRITIWYRQRGLTLIGTFIHIGRLVLSFSFCYRTDPDLRAHYGRFFLAKMAYLTKKGGNRCAQ